MGGLNAESFKMILLPTLGLGFAIAIVWVVMLILQRSNNIKKATDHAWVEIWPEVGKVYSYLTPILGDGTVRIQDRHGNDFARYTLASGAAKKADWPPGKTNFVQVTLDKVIYRENDSLPMSAVIKERPIFDAHQLDSLVEKVAFAAAEATRLSLEESKGTIKKQNPLMYVYIGLVIAIVGIAYVAITQHGSGDILANIMNGVNRIGAGLGVPTAGVPK